MNSIERAKTIARLAHAGQTDKAGRPYIEHVRRVVLQVRPEYQAVAWLHDVLEDCPWITADHLGAAGVLPQIIEDVLTLTHRPSEAYTDYIQCIAMSLSPAPRAVKVADLHDHLRPGYETWLSLASIDKYRAALAVLEGR